MLKPIFAGRESNISSCLYGINRSIFGRCIFLLVSMSHAQQILENRIIYFDSTLWNYNAIKLRESWARHPKYRLFLAPMCTTQIDRMSHELLGVHSQHEKLRVKDGPIPW